MPFDDLIIDEKNPVTHSIQGTGYLSYPAVYLVLMVLRTYYLLVVVISCARAPTKREVAILATYLTRGKLDRRPAAGNYYEVLPTLQLSLHTGGV